MPDNATLRDSRRSFQFWLDDAILDHFGAELGPFALAVYLALARRAKHSKAFPSTARIAKDTGMSKDSVKRALKRLQDLGLIEVTLRYTEDGDSDSNLYTLLDLSAYHETPPSNGRGGRCSQHPPSISQHLPVGAHSTHGGCSQHPEGSSLKDPQLEGSPLSVSLPPGEETHTHTDPGNSPQGGGGKTGFPESPESVEALKLEVLSPDLEAWVVGHAVTLNLAQEFERWIAHGLAHGKTYCNMAAAFKQWLLNPLTRRFQEDAPGATQKQAPSRAGAGAQVQESGREAQEAEAALRQDPAYVAELDRARDTAMKALGKVLGPQWRAQAEADTRRERMRAGRGVPSSSPVTPSGEEEGAA